MAILDFLYFGEANVCRDNLDSFLAIAEELKLKGLTGQRSGDLLEEDEAPTNHKPANKPKESLVKSKTYKNNVSNRINRNSRTDSPLYTMYIPISLCMLKTPFLISL